MSKKIDIKNGNRYGNLVILNEVFGKNKRYFECICDCGNTTIKWIDGLMIGYTISCGCVKKDKLRRANTTHGHSSRGNRSNAYRAWDAMKNRCNTNNSNTFKNYKGRGITYDKRWESFTNFLEDMGDPPTKTQIDRIDNDGNYCKENCRWATPQQQANNKQNSRYITVFNQRKTITELCSIFKMCRKTVSDRIARGWGVEKALTTPPCKKHWSRARAQKMIEENACVDILGI